MSGDVIIEYTRVGGILRVTAVDAATGTEAVFQAPLNASPADLERIAVKKLEYVLQRQKKS